MYRKIKNKSSTQYIVSEKNLIYTIIELHISFRYVSGVKKKNIKGTFFLLL